ncbi:glycosyltransferase [Bordetella sputigena]|uniref:glycosyltransferase family 2 protein n=1 Tax=Bordetella sputigena TaxID=1416810 RepID=UPI0039EE61D5
MSRIKDLILRTGAKVAKPLRMARAGARGIRQAGGVRLVSRKVINIYRREGVAGIRRGIGLFRHAIHNRSGLDRNNYAAWLLQYDTLTDETRKEMARLGDGLRMKPLISIIMPVYNPAPGWLREAIESVRDQVYSEWELCIADDASTDPAVHDVLRHYQSLDPRIKVVFRESNGHISAASNSALEIARGDWIALFDHDDLLSAHALFWMAEAINRSPGVGLLYSDEDKITEKGVRTEPHFKCDWNYELFLSYNMISHLGLYRADLVREVGGFRLGFEGAQDYDLALRCIERLAPSQIVHVPRVLYHWRIHAASTAQAGDSKPYALLAGERALNEHIRRVGHQARAELQPRGYYRVRFDLPIAQPLVSLIIPTRNGETLVRQCIDSILQKTTYLNYEILLVDNGSDDAGALAYFQELARHPRIRVIRDDRPFNYSALNNGAVAQANGEYVALVNNDIEVISPDWLSEMMSYAIQPGVGAVGARLFYPDRTVQHAGVILGLGGGGGA